MTRLRINKNMDLVSIANDICEPGFAYVTFYALASLVKQAEETHDVVEGEVADFMVSAYPLKEVK